MLDFEDVHKIMLEDFGEPVVLRYKAYSKNIFAIFNINDPLAFPLNAQRTRPEYYLLCNKIDILGVNTDWIADIRGKYYNIIGFSPDPERALTNELIEVHLSCQ